MAVMPQVQSALAGIPVMTQRAILILPDRKTAELVERALAEHGLILHEIRPSVFAVEPIPTHLRRQA
jgi:hypothetical protein